MNYPQCEKAKEVRDKSQAIGEFINFYAHPKELAKDEIQYTKDEVIDFFTNDYRQSIIGYAKKNLPAAVIKEVEQETF